ncbi:hypothetical protein ABIF68_000953 [Bradyrhizobium japonicum]
MPIKAIRLKSNPNAIKARVGRDAAVDNRAGRIVLRVCMPPWVGQNPPGMVT